MIMSTPSKEPELKEVLDVAITACSAAGFYLSAKSLQNHKDLKMAITSQSAKYYVKYIELGKRLREGIKNKSNTKEDIEAAKSIYKFFRASQYYKKHEVGYFAAYFASKVLYDHCVKIYGKCLDSSNNIKLGEVS